MIALTLTTEQIHNIRDLSYEATEHGDNEMADLCRIALDEVGKVSARARNAARVACLQVIADVAAETSWLI